MKELMILIAAMIQVESGGVDDAIGKQGEIGCLQITTGCLLDVNRVYGMRFSELDCYNRKKSILICILYLDHYMPFDRELINQSTEYCLEKWARVWNGGPDGCYKASTFPYWDKVKAQLERQGRCVKN